MARIKIIVDTAADMPPELLKKYDMGLLSFLSVFGNDTYVTGVDITNAQFYDLLDASKKPPTTSQTPYADMYDTLLKASKENDTVIYFTISSKGSGQNHTAHMVRDEILENDNPNADIRIVDSMKYSLYIAQTAITAAKLAEKGMSADEIIKFCEKYITTWHCFLLVDTMKYLEKGGRVNKATAFVGELLDIKPILTIEHGLVEFEDKLRGKKKVFDKLIAKIKEYPTFDSSNPQFLIVHSGAEKCSEMIQKLKSEFGNDCIELVSEFAPIVGTHVGRNAIAAIFRTTERIDI